MLAGQQRGRSALCEELLLLPPLRELPPPARERSAEGVRLAATQGFTPAESSPQDWRVGLRTAKAAAFELLVSPQLDRSYRLALTLSGNHHEAENLVQEAALRAFDNFEQFLPGSNFKAWFYRIVVNCFLENCRRRKTRGESAVLEEDLDLYLFRKSSRLGVLNPMQDPVRKLLNRLTVEQISEAIQSLPEEYGIVASLYFVDDLTYVEIGEIVECPLGTVRSRIHRSRKMLQKALWDLAVDQGIIAGEKKRSDS